MRALRMPAGALVTMMTSPRSRAERSGSGTAKWSSNGSVATTMPRVSTLEATASGSRVAAAPWLGNPATVGRGSFGVRRGMITAPGAASRTRSSTSARAGRSSRRRRVASSRTGPGRSGGTGRRPGPAARLLAYRVDPVTTTIATEQIAPITALDRTRLRARLRLAIRPPGRRPRPIHSSFETTHGAIAIAPITTARPPAMATTAQSDELFDCPRRRDPATAMASKAQPAPTAAAPITGSRRGTCGSGRRPASACRVGTRAAERAGSHDAPAATTVPMAMIGSRSANRTTGPATGRPARSSMYRSGTKRVPTIASTAPETDPMRPASAPCVTRNHFTVTGAAPEAVSSPIERSWRRAPTANAAVMTVPSTISPTPPPRYTQNTPEPPSSREPSQKSSTPSTLVDSRTSSGSRSSGMSNPTR